jgi:hypothetical protein
VRAHAHGVAVRVLVDLGRMSGLLWCGGCWCV